MERRLDKRPSALLALTEQSTTKHMLILDSVGMGSFGPP
jgi:hypothetical protein